MAVGHGQEPGLHKLVLVALQPENGPFSGHPHLDFLVQLIAFFGQPDIEQGRRFRTEHVKAMGIVQHPFFGLGIIGIRIAIFHDEIPFVHQHSGKRQKLTQFGHHFRCRLKAFDLNAANRHDRILEPFVGVHFDFFQQTRVIPFLTGILFAKSRIGKFGKGKLLCRNRLAGIHDFPLDGSAGLSNQWHCNQQSTKEDRQSKRATIPHRYSSWLRIIFLRVGGKNLTAFSSRAASNSYDRREVPRIFFHATIFVYNNLK